MNSTNVSAHAALDSASYQNMVFQTPLIILLLPINFLGVITNGAVVLTIWKTKSMHNKSQFMILSHAVSEIYFSATSLVVGIVRINLLLLNQPETNYQWRCILYFSPHFVVSKITNLMTLALGADRFLAVAAPIFYKNIRPARYIIGINVVCWSFCIIQIPMAFSYDPIESMRWSICRFVSAYPLAYQNANNVQTTVLLVATFVVYAFALATVLGRYLRLKSEQKNNLSAGQVSDWRRQLEMGAFKTMMTVVTSYLITWGMFNICSFLYTNYMAQEMAVKLAGYLNIMIPIYSTTHICIYLRMSTNFRKAFMSYIPRWGNRTTVQPFRTTS